MKDTHNELISIIIPVYNVEKYLDRCIKSVINQTYKNIEIILIDDGSTDKSLDICYNYLEQDNRIKVFHKENGGLSSARNYGIDVATGKYLTFIDSDDEIEKDYIEYLYNLIKKYDTKMSICSYSVIKNNITDFGLNLCEKLLTTEECLDNLLCEKGFTVSACAKMYEKDLFKNIRYPLNKLCEDNGTTYKLIMECNNIAYGNESKYNYYIHDNSITTSEFNLRKLDLIELVDTMCDDIIKRFPDLINSVEKRRNSARFSILRQMLESKNSNNYINIQKDIIKYLKSKKKKIITNPKSDKKDKLAIVLLMINKNLFKLGWKIYLKFIK